MEPEQYRLLYEVEQQHWWHRVVRRAIASAVSGHRPGQRLTILDAGCGTGGVLQALRAEHDAFGIDPSPFALDFCRSRGLRGLARASTDRLPFADSTFDVIISIDVISQDSVPSELLALRDLRRVLRPGGILVLQVSAFEWLRGEHDRSVGQRRRYSRHELVGHLRDADLHCESCRYRLAFLPPLMLLNNLLRRLRRSEGRPDIELPSGGVNALLHTAGLLDLWLGGLAPWGSCLFAIARR